MAPGNEKSEWFYIRQAPVGELIDSTKVFGALAAVAFVVGVVLMYVASFFESPIRIEVSDTGKTIGTLCYVGWVLWYLRKHCMSWQQRVVVMLPAVTIWAAVTLLPAEFATGFVVLVCLPGWWLISGLCSALTNAGRQRYEETSEIERICQLQRAELDRIYDLRPDLIPRDGPPPSRPYRASAS